MGEIAIGIDLGTSNSCVAVTRGSSVEVLPNAYGEQITASVVAFQADGSITVGNAAKANIIHEPRRTIHSSKRLIGRYFFSEEVKKAQAIYSYEIAEGENHGIRIKVAEELFSLPEVGAMILREMKSIAESRLGQTVNKAVITVPAYFNDNQRQATKDAGRIAGLEVLRILNEPTAAAVAYGFGRGLNQRVAVWDLGGGTFDISILEIGDDVFEVLSTAGDTFLGGDDFDDRLIDLLADEFATKEGINLRNDPYALEKLKVAAEGAKKGLSVEDEVEIRIPDIITAPDGSPRSIERTLGTQEYAGLVNDLVHRTFKVCDEALQEAGVVARDLDGVILVGGPTRLPLIRNAVTEYFQQEVKSDVDPDQVVAMGASIHAASLISPTTETYLLDVTPISLRIGVVGGLADSVIERNTPVPIEQTRSFTTVKDHQESVEIKVYQGESQEAAENELLGQFSFSDFKKGRRGEVEIDVTFEINTDGIVAVTARDRATGKQASTRITLSSGLDEGEMQEIIEENRTERVQTSAEQAGETLGAIPLKQVAAPAGLVEVDGSEKLDMLEEDGLVPLEGNEDILQPDASEDILAVEDATVAPLDGGEPPPPPEALTEVLDTAEPVVEAAAPVEAPAPDVSDTEVVLEPEVEVLAAPEPEDLSGDAPLAVEAVTDEMEVFPIADEDEPLIPEDVEIEDTPLEALTEISVAEDDVEEGIVELTNVTEHTTEPKLTATNGATPEERETLFETAGTELTSDDAGSEEDKA